MSIGLAAYLVDGQHDALIGKTLVYQVQDFLDGRKKRRTFAGVTPPGVSVNALPLQGFLICPKYGRRLSGSVSKSSMPIIIITIVRAITAGKTSFTESGELNAKTEQARDFLLSGEFTGADFQAINRACKNRIKVLESRLPDLAFAVKKCE